MVFHLLSRWWQLGHSSSGMISAPPWSFLRTYTNNIHIEGEINWKWRIELFANLLGSKCRCMIVISGHRGTMIQEESQNSWRFRIQCEPNLLNMKILSKPVLLATRGPDEFLYLSPLQPRSRQQLRNPNKTHKLPVLLEVWLFQDPENLLFLGNRLSGVISVLCFFLLLSLHFLVPIPQIFPSRKQLKLFSNIPSCSYWVMSMNSLT